MVDGSRPTANLSKYKRKQSVDYQLIQIRAIESFQAAQAATQITILQQWTSFHVSSFSQSDASMVQDWVSKEICAEFSLTFHQCHLVMLQSLKESSNTTASKHTDVLLINFAKNFSLLKILQIKSNIKSRFCLNCNFIINFTHFGSAARLFLSVRFLKVRWYLFDRIFLLPLRPNKGPLI